MTDLTGFTLFKITKGWQMSTRVEGEVGWFVRFVTEERAREILAQIPETGHKPQGMAVLPAPSTTFIAKPEPPKKVGFARRN